MAWGFNVIYPLFSFGVGLKYVENRNIVDVSLSQLYYDSINYSDKERKG